ncbi:hypothetical protein BJX70DRAFT_351092 [Aspergillus crustosus]
MAEMTLGPDEWRIVFENLDRQELCNVCLVTRSCCGLATPLLYKSITLIQADTGFPYTRSRKPDHTSRHWNLLDRLEDVRNDSLRNFVQEVTIASPDGERTDTAYLRRLKEDGCLAKLIARLPNIRKINLSLSVFQTDDFIRSICTHSNKPELTLKLNNHCAFADQPVPCISSLRAWLNPFWERNGPNRKVPELQQLFFNCPNLRSFSLQLSGNYGGCVAHIPHFPQILSFQLTGKEVFPPLEELSLDGYRMGDDEWVHWHDRFQWSRLLILTVGPQDTFGLFDRIAGYITSLTTLRVFKYADERTPDREGLERFLVSFDSLTTLELKGYICSVDAIGHHEQLTSLCLHEDEPVRGGAQRRVLTAQELDYLDSHCPNLRSLKVDIQRGNDEMPEDVLQKLATGFRRLQDLSIHFELGIANRDKVIRPVLNYASARGIGQSFFDQRRQSEIDTTTSYALTLWTGSSFRRFPQWEPEYSLFEKNYTATFELRLADDSADELVFRHHEREDKERRDSTPGRRSGPAPWEINGVEEAVEGAVDGWDNRRKFGSFPLAKAPPS